MGYVIRMPQMGMSMDSGTVVEWAVEEGEAVEEGAVVVVVESEKASNEVEAREDGVLRAMLVPPDGAVEPGAPIGVVAGPDEDLSQFADEIGDVEFEASPAGTGGDGAAAEGDAAAAAGDGDATDADDAAVAAAEAASAEAGVSSAADEGATGADEGAAGAEEGAAGAEEGAAGAGSVRATPGAKRRAEAEGVALGGVEGTGPQGVVTEDDVETHLESAAGDESTTGGEQTPSRGTSSGGGAAAADVRAAPGARRLAESEGVDLGTVEGTGPQGVVTESDVESYLEAGGGVAPSATRTVTEARPLKGIQKTVSDRLSESYRNAVHVTLNRSFDVAALREVSAAADSVPEAADVSITDLLLKAVGDTLAAFPAFNALFEDGEHRLIEEVNVGVAVDVEEGLLTPVLSSVDQKSAEAVNRVRRQRTERALSGEFSMDDLSGGTFTVSNLGLFGVDDFDPIINPPQVAILGVGRIRDDGEMTLSLSFDHRVVNGADAARFLDSLVERLTDAATLAGYFEATLDVAGGPDEREILVKTGEGYRGRYRTAHGDVDFDEPESVGGTGSAPAPVDHLLGALGSCVSLMVRDIARRDEIGLDDVSATVRGSPDEGALTAVDVELELETDADEAAVDRVVTKAERACYVARALSEDLPVTLEWRRV
ncbi:MAG: 2-oxo acid dehydrogenase subunit E2 [Salinigranum sp.]